MTTKAVTFDFWDTLVFDNSDEPKRKAMGLLPKPEARLKLITEEITAHHTGVAPEQIALAYDRANERCRHSWKVEHITPSVAERVGYVFDILGIPSTPGFFALVREIEEMEVKIPPDFVSGVHEVLPVLALGYKLGLISDTVHTPGRGIRELLEKEDLLKHFDHCVFSDEAGASKPNHRVFDLAAEGLGTSFEDMVHIGDRESNDIAGSVALGMRAILFTSVLDRGSDSTQAHAVCQKFKDLPDIIRSLDQS